MGIPPEPAAVEVHIPRKIWTREEARQLADLDFPNAGRLELVDGEIIDRMGKKRPHILWHTLVRRWLEQVFGWDHVQSEAPIDVAPADMPTSEPEPDLIVTIKSVREFPENPKPEDIRLVVEISDTTVWYDRNVKAELYARAGIVEYWILNIPQNEIIVHREPRHGSYTRIATYASNEEMMPLAADAIFCLDRL